jgi:hypothetical protein
MTKTSMSQINGVAVAAFALSIVLGASLTDTVHHPRARNHRHLGRTVSPVCHQSSPSMGEGGTFAFRKICGTTRTGIIPHRAYP